MSRFLTAASTMQRLSLAAMEESSRDGRRDADIEHLFLALVLSEQTAGQVLRSMGINLDAARTAVRDQHEDQLAALGLSFPVHTPGRIVFHETDGYEWRQRAMDILTRATDGANGGDASDVLRGLMAEPSGLIGEILERLGTTPDAVIAALDDAEVLRVAASGPKALATLESFVPAPIDDVWALVSDVKRMPEWNPYLGVIDDEGTNVWSGRARMTTADGRPIKVRPKYLRRSIQRVESLDPTRVTWQIGFSDVPNSASQTQSIDLAPAAGGTQIVLTWALSPRSGWRRIVGGALRPLHRFMAWLMLTQMASAISRAFR